MHKSPIVYNVDWSIPVPLQMIGFHLILKAAQKPVSFEVLLETSLGTGVMLAVGYAGKTGVLEVWIGSFADASDALDKIRYESIIYPDKIEAQPIFFINAKI